eukprot:gene20300-2568_t
MLVLAIAVLALIPRGSSVGQVKYVGASYKGLGSGAAAFRSAIILLKTEQAIPTDDGSGTTITEVYITTSKDSTPFNDAATNAATKNGGLWTVPSPDY